MYQLSWEFYLIFYLKGIGDFMRLLSYGFRNNCNYIIMIKEKTLAALKIKLISIFMPDPRTINF